MCAFGFLVAVVLAFLLVAIPFALQVFPVVAGFVVLGLSIGFGVVIMVVVIACRRN